MDSGFQLMGGGAGLRPACIAIPLEGLRASSNLSLAPPMMGKGRATQPGAQPRASYTLFPVPPTQLLQHLRNL